MTRIKWKVIKVHPETHKKLMILKKRQGRAIWEIIDDAITPKTTTEAYTKLKSSEFDRHMWYLLKFTMSYGYLKASLIYSDDYRDAYRLFEQRCHELEKRLGIETKRVAKRVLNLLTGRSKRIYKERIMEANKIIKEIMKQVILSAFR